MMISIDMVIPSYRLQQEILLPIIQLPVPEDVLLHMFIVVDNLSIEIPEELLRLHEAGKIRLLINEKNLGFSASRNKGIMAGNADYILLLDDDIVPDSQLLFAYAAAVRKEPAALGYAGVTRFPEPFNDITTALAISGTTHHFSLPARGGQMCWTPTANVLLKRDCFNDTWFDGRLKYGGEDIALLASVSLQTNRFLIAVPDAVVTHPWWNNGRSQLRRMFRYGRGAADILANKIIRKYSWVDFTNSSESLFILLLASPFLICYHKTEWLLYIGMAFILAEFITNYFRIRKEGKSSVAIAWQLMLHKNARELGALFQTLKRGRLQDFTRRLDVGFSKPNPSPYRLNRWKILKSLLILGIILLIVSIRTTG